METLIMTSQVLLGISVLVILHELGHFIAARIFGIKVEKFFLFFDVNDIKLFSIRKKDTEYGIGWLPLGGYVKIAGMIDESMDTEAMKQPPQPWEFRTRPAWQRLIVMVGGVTVNLILGMAIFVFITWLYGERYIPMSQLKYGIVALELGREMGLQTGDKILKVNGRIIEKFSEATNPKIFVDRNVVITVERNGQFLDIPVPNNLLQKISKTKELDFIEFRRTFFVNELLPGGNAERAGILTGDKITEAAGKTVQFFDEFRDILRENKGKDINLLILRQNDTIFLSVPVDTSGKIGIGVGNNDIKEVAVYYNFFESIGKGSAKAIETLVLNIKGLGKVIRGEVDASEAISGPIRIATIYGGTWDWLKFWTITGILSMVLAFMNILPIPALDGGHVLFLSIEAISGKKFSDKFMENTQRVGLVLIIGLMVLIIGNDIWKIIQ